MSFRYHNQKLKFSMEEMIKELQRTCEGKNLSIGEITCDEDGFYSEEKLLVFLDELVNADWSEEDGVLFSAADWEAHRKDNEYLKTLLYVLIRSMQAQIAYFTCPYGVIPCTSDTFEDLLLSVNGMGDWIRPVVFGKEPQREHLVSASLEATARSLYHYITGEDMAFPDPYSVKAAEPAPVVKTEETGVQEDVQEDVQDDIPGDVSDDWDEYDFDYYSGLIQAIRQDREEWYYHGDPASEKDWEEDSDKDAFDQKRYYIGDLSTPEAKERFEKQQRRVRFFFRNRQEYVEKYRELARLNESGSERYKNILDTLPAKVTAWLQDHDRTVYTDAEFCGRVFDMIYAATRDVIRWQGKQ